MLDSVSIFVRTFEEGRKIALLINPNPSSPKISNVNVLDKKTWDYGRMFLYVIKDRCVIEIRRAEEISGDDYTVVEEESLPKLTHEEIVKKLGYDFEYRG